MNFKNCFNYAAIATIFSEAFTFYTFFPSQLFNVIKYYNVILFIVIAVLFIINKRIYFHKAFFILFLIIVFFSFINILAGDNTIKLLLQQIIGITIHSLAFYNLFKFNNLDVKKIFKVYLNIAFFVALIGVVQASAYHIFIFFNLGLSQHFSKVKYLFDYSFFMPRWAPVFGFGGLRVNSIMLEPFSFCVAMMPALFAGLTCFSKHEFHFLTKTKAAIIILTFLLTFSTVGYFGLFCAFFLLMLNNVKPKHSIPFFIGVIIFFLILYASIPDFKVRITQTLEYITGKLDWQKANMSLYTLIRNSLVTFDVLKDNVLFGHGLGSHLLSFFHFTEKTKIPEPYGLFVVNQYDAGSLFLRLLSETGLFGLLLFSIFVVKFFINKKQSTPNYLWLINNSILILFIIRLIRQGHYFSEGFFFFIWIYYFSKIKCDEQKRSIGQR